MAGKRETTPSFFSNSEVKSELFYGKLYIAIATKIKTYLNAQSKETLWIGSSVRTAGDRIPETLKKEISKILGDFATNISFPTSRKKKANIIFDGKDGMKYFLDIISHNTETTFNMPNITSVDILQELYSDNRNLFIVLLIDYSPSLSSNFITNILFTPLEFLSWECLTIGALGTGQIQIKRASKITKINKYSRKDWMNDFTEYLITFYVNETHKFGTRLLKANNTRVEWLNRDDVWS